MFEDKLPHNHGKLPKNLIHAMPREQAFSTVADTFKFMSDEKRIQIFFILCHCEECTVNLSAMLGISQSTVIDHLKSLKDSGLILSRHKGSEIYYTSSETLQCNIFHEMTEKLLELTCPSDHIFKENHINDSKIQIINEIHSLLTADLKRRYTIEELSSMFHINITTLKSTFKSTFGSPIATYMKEYRIKSAMIMLQSTDMPISDIAREIGYANQSKFTQAFKDITGTSPTNYRKK